MQIGCGRVVWMTWMWVYKPAKTSYRFPTSETGYRGHNRRTKLLLGDFIGWEHGMRDAVGRNGKTIFPVCFSMMSPKQLGFRQKLSGKSVK
ncbi:hypothetical protein LOAG_04764 [Loa loa]|uniref:Uncharacterized protein n=1 Tax=Loa loa TaxID=7209 RepID=A0A1S0U165_LOALO|nr:hypothetical protein LOAG_04764 [Loa loa]EFO23723.2 hypothetical protein LOAG_04764 [Loa loa]